MGLQWSHCLRTFCNKNFKGWIAGFNPFCQLIEKRTLGYPGILAAGSYSRYQYTKHWLLATISQKKGYAPRNFHAEDKHGAAPGRFEPLHGHQGWCRQLQLDTASFATYRAKINFQALAWWNIWPIALFGMPAPQKNFSGPKKFFLPPASFAT